MPSSRSSSRLVCDIGGLWFQQIERRLSPAPAIVKIKGFCCFLYFTCDACAENISRSSHDEGKCKCADGGGIIKADHLMFMNTRKCTFIPISARCMRSLRESALLSSWVMRRREEEERGKKVFHKLQQMHALHVFTSLWTAHVKTKLHFF